MQLLSVRFKALVICFCLFASSPAFCGLYQFSCRFAVRAVSDANIARKSLSHSLAKKSFLGKGEAQREGRDSIFLDELRKVLRSGPDVSTRVISGGSLGEEYYVTLDRFSKWFDRIERVFMAELDRQGRNDDERQIFTNAFAEYRAHLDELRSKKFANEVGVINSGEKLEHVLNKLYSLKCRAAELVFATTRSDLVCVSCQSAHFLAKLFGTNADDANFIAAMDEVFSNEPLRSLLIGEIDAAVLHDGKLQAFEFKFNPPVNREQHGQNGRLTGEKAKGVAKQLLRTAKLLSVISSSLTIFKRHGFALVLTQTPELIFSPMTAYSTTTDLGAFVQNTLGKVMPSNVVIKNRPVMTESEIETILAEVSAH
jgi:hypothetical protein